MKRLLLAALVPVAMAQAECVMTDRVTTAATVRIEERSDIQKHIVPSPSAGYLRCQVSYKARINARWYLAMGAYDWPGDTSNDEACAVAMNRADASVRTQVAPVGVRAESTMVCTDRPNMETLNKTAIGSQGQLHQFRPHPDYAKEFWHNGARCRWFLDTDWTGTDIRTRNGVICKLQNDLWVVVDKF